MPRKTQSRDGVKIDELLTAREVGEILGLSAGTLANWRSLGIGPTNFKVGGRVRYRASSVNDWIAEQEHDAVG
ncbi:AlpA family transcriptional regulator [Brachybacterium sp. P6-10-X1]|uniref:helix-turn-helix transcriptional regulator n=1 Tax=Brachybacterium sp. P6-10-X1 TaxID=1903186 RepID=UPI00155FCD24|nr:helix-turn-helix domain-containing protein [Brachybacterium sp. P6-10-X1]